VTNVACRIGEVGRMFLAIVAVALVFTADLLLSELAGFPVPLAAAVFTATVYTLWRAVWLLYSGRRASTALERAALPYGAGGRGVVAVLACSYLAVFSWQLFLWELFSLSSSAHGAVTALVGLGVGAVLYLSARWMGARSAASEIPPDVQPLHDTSGWSSRG